MNKIVLSALLSAWIGMMILTGCGSGQETSQAENHSSSEIVSSSEADSSSDEADELTDEEILEQVKPYLEDMVYQDPALYPSMNDFLSANLGLTQEEAASAVLYMGAPNQNTGYFLMLTKAENADTNSILEKLNSTAEGQVHTAEMGYTQGYTGYEIIDKDTRIFLVMHPDADRFNELVDLLENL